MQANFDGTAFDYLFIRKPIQNINTELQETLAVQVTEFKINEDKLIQTNIDSMKYQHLYDTVLYDLEHFMDLFRDASLNTLSEEFERTTAYNIASRLNSDIYEGNNITNIDISKAQVRNKKYEEQKNYIYFKPNDTIYVKLINIIYGKKYILSTDPTYNTYNSNTKYFFTIGNYIFKNIPSDCPITFLNNTDISYNPISSTTFNNTKDVNGNTYRFLDGTISLDISNNFTRTSLYPYYNDKYFWLKKNIYYYDSKNIYDISSNIDPNDPTKMINTFNYNHKEDTFFKYKHNVLKILDGLQSSIQLYKKCMKIHEDNTLLEKKNEEYKDILSNRDKLEEYYRKKSSNVGSLTTTLDFSDLSYTLLPQIEIYLKRHGAPPNGVFSYEKMVPIINELIEAGILECI